MRRSALESTGLGYSLPIKGVRTPRKINGFRCEIMWPTFAPAKPQNFNKIKVYCENFRTLSPSCFCNIFILSSRIARSSFWSCWHRHFVSRRDPALVWRALHLQLLHQSSGGGASRKGHRDASWEGGARWIQIKFRFGRPSLFLSLCHTFHCLLLEAAF